MNSFDREGDPLSNFNWVKTSGYFGELLVQMTTPHVVLTCLINSCDFQGRRTPPFRRLTCPPSGNEFDNSAPQLSISKNS